MSKVETKYWLVLDSLKPVFLWNSFFFCWTCWKRFARSYGCRRSRHRRSHHCFGIGLCIDLRRVGHIDLRRWPSLHETAESSGLNVGVEEVLRTPALRDSIRSTIFFFWSGFMFVVLAGTELWRTRFSLVVSCKGAPYHNPRCLCL